LTFFHKNDFFSDIWLRRPSFARLVTEQRAAFIKLGVLRSANRKILKLRFASGLLAFASRFCGLAKAPDDHILPARIRSGKTSQTPWALNKAA
jgi:hypothetical protein